MHACLYVRMEIKNENTATLIPTLLINTSKRNSNVINYIMICGCILIDHYNNHNNTIPRLESLLRKQLLERLLIF